MKGGLSAGPAAGSTTKKYYNNSLRTQSHWKTFPRSPVIFPVAEEITQRPAEFPTSNFPLKSPRNNKKNPNVEIQISLSWLFFFVWNYLIITIFFFFFFCADMYTCLIVYTLRLLVAHLLLLPPLFFFS